MNDEELRVLIQYHAELAAKWVQAPRLASKSHLIYHAGRALELINELPEEREGEKS